MAVRPLRPSIDGLQRFAADILAFWAPGAWCGAVLSGLAAAAPGSGTPPILVLAAVALAGLFSHTAWAVWQPSPSAGRAMRRPAIGVGPLLVVATWSVSRPRQLPSALTALAIAWGLFVLVAFWLARRFERAT